MRNLMLTAVCTLMLTTAGTAAEWGTITGKIVLKGDVPKPVLLHAKGATIKDAEVCAAGDVYKDDLVVNPDNKGIANVFIYLAKKPKSVHPDGKKAPAEVIFDQKNCVFMPHAMVLQAGTTVEVLNSDPIAHNTHTYALRNQQYNVLVAPNTAKGDGVEIVTTTRESLPHQVKCDYHPWMMAQWLVVDHPYAAVTDADGNFTIKNLPVGDHTFRIWHERAGYLERKKKISVKAGDNPALADISVAASKLEEK